VRQHASLIDADALPAAGFGEFETEAALADPGVADHTDDATVALDDISELEFEGRDLIEALPSEDRRRPYKITAAGYTLHPDYTQLMLADNNLNTDENIFMIAYDGTYIQNYGGTTYLIHGPANIPGSVTGCNGSWTGLRLTQQSVQLFQLLVYL